MKKCFCTCGILLCLFVTFFDPFKLRLYLTLPTVINFLMLASTFFVFYKNRKALTEVKLSKADILCGSVLGFCMTLGYGLIRGHGFGVFYSSPVTVLFTLLSLALHICFSLLLLKFFFLKAEEWMDKKRTVPSVKNRFIGYILKKIEENRFLFYFLFFILIWLIPFIISFPGFTMFDTRNQIDMYYHIPNLHTNATVLLDESQYVTQHHSVPHTLFLGLVFDLGMALFKTYEAGIFIYCLIQYIAVAMAMGYMFKWLKKHLDTKYIFLGLVLFGIHPFFPISAFLMTKDVLFCGLFVIYIIKYYELLKEPDSIKKPRFFISFLAVSIGLLLLRNNAFYSMVLISLALLIFVRNRGYIALYTCIFIVFNTVFTSVLLPYFNFTPGSPREMLSIPFQQTAAYVNKFPDDVTAEEKAVISKILDWETVENEYNPELSDPVKDTFNKYSTSEDLKNYIVTWAKMLVKHPGVYVEAFIEQNYGYYYPGVKDPMTYDTYNDYHAKKAMVSDGIPTLKPARPRGLERVYFWIQNTVYHFPFICLLTDTGVYFWLWIFMMLLIIRKFEDKKRYLLYYVPYFAFLVFFLVGPANGTIYIRYIMPFVFAIILTVLPLFEYKNKME